MQLADILQPVQSAEFFADYWEQAPLFVPNPKRSDFSALLDLEGLDNILARQRLRADECKAAFQGDIVPPSAYLAEPGMRVMGRAAPDWVNTSRLLQLFADGATLVFAQLNHRWPALEQLRHSLTRELNATLVTNVFLTNRHAQGFSAHYDSHDVIVLQLAGSKYWTLYDSPVELPLKSQAFGSTDVSPGPVAQQAMLSAGDVLYIPRGHFHEAQTTDSVSLHLTLGIHPYLWSDLLADLVRQVAHEDASLRRSVPRNFLDLAPGQRVAALAEQVAKLQCDLQLAQQLVSAKCRREQSGSLAAVHSLSDIVASAELDSVVA